MIITAKDAVKCHDVAHDLLWMHKVWILDVVAKPDTKFLEKLAEAVRHLKESI